MENTNGEACSVNPTPDSRKEESWRGEVQSLLARRWADFVNCPRRLLREGRFLDGFTARYDAPRILDAAMGIGCEAAYLAKRNLAVTGNEIDPDLRRIAAAEAKREGVSFAVTQYDWRELEQRCGRNSFDIVLLMGNSLCLLREESARVEAARNLRAICHNGGTVIVDQRNFNYILKERESVLAGHFRYSGEVMYCGDLVKGLPVAIHNDCVAFSYVDRDSEEVIGHLDMYPFGTRELPALFLQAGFRHFDLYSDLKAGYKETADFYTYAFR